MKMSQYFPKPFISFGGNFKFQRKFQRRLITGYLFVNGKEIHKFKPKNSEIVETPLCLGNISKDCSIDNMKKSWIKWVCL